jgi:magnesium-transporting ATPase (P-type)
MCFDKTGTLTEEGLDTHGVVVSKGDSQSMHPFVEAECIKELLGEGGLSKTMFDIMGACHSLTRV